LATPGGDTTRPDEAEREPARVPVATLTPGPTPRLEPLDEDHVRALAERLPELPPILVQRETRAVIDGAHRVAAARLRGVTDIAAVFFDGTDEEALVESIRRNVEHGKPLTLGERSRAALEVLRLHGSWSDRRIAGVCGLSPKTIGRLRNRATEETPQLRGRTGLDERARPTDPAAVRQLVADLLREHPQASLRVVAAAAGTSPSTVRDVRGRMGRGEDILPGRLRAAAGRAESPAPAPLDLRDPSLEMAPIGQALLDWMSRTDLQATDWGDFVEAIPLSRLYGLVDESRRRAEEWRRFAADLEARARREGSPTHRD
jgi:ParB-like chromosome segregation protein Spo0J